MGGSSQLEELKDLWQIVFNDNRDFIDFYFKNMCRLKNVVASKRNGKIIAALHMIPYDIKLCGEIFAASYISGAATLPLWRRQGIMEAILKHAIQKMFKRNIGLSFLIPAPGMEQYYNKFGFATVFGESKIALHSEDINTKNYHLNCWSEPRSIPQKMFDWIESIQLSNYNNIVIHKGRELKACIEDKLKSGGHLYCLRHNGDYVGALIDTIIEDSSYIDCFYDKQSSKNILFKLYAEEKQYKHIWVKSPVEDVGNIDYQKHGMARIINVASFINVLGIKFPQAIYITDPIIPQNNGILSKDGHFSTIEVGDCRVKNMDKTTIQKFTEYILQTHPIPYMTLMMD